MERKIIQLVTQDDGDDYPLIALCDDGTVWMLRPSGWSEIRAKIPGTGIPTLNPQIGEDWEY